MLGAAAPPATRSRVREASPRAGRVPDSGVAARRASGAVAPGGGWVADRAGGVTAGAAGGERDDQTEDDQDLAHLFLLRHNRAGEGYAGPASKSSSFRKWNFSPVRTRNSGRPT